MRTASLAAVRSSPTDHRVPPVAVRVAACVASALLLAASGTAVAEDGSDGVDGATDAGHASEETFHALHPPIGIAAGHTLAGGSIAIGYAFYTERYDGLRAKTSDLSPSRFVARTGYTAAPTALDVERHEFQLMVAPSHRVTAMLTVPFVRKEMRSVTAGGAYVERSEGLGDITLTGIARFMERGDERLFFTTELGIPTGSISRRDDTSPAGDTRLPYPMQLGSGVWHLAPGLTYVGHTWKYTWGGQVTTLFRFGDNGAGYTPGNLYRVSGWIARRWIDLVSTSLRLEYARWGNTSGDDPRIDATFTPVGDPMRQRGERLDLVSGLDLHLPFAPHQSLAVEVGFPLAQDLDGPQPSFDWNLRAGWRWAF